jgi:hypothetical protein
MRWPVRNKEEIAKIAANEATLGRNLTATGCCAIAHHFTAMHLRIEAAVTAGARLTNVSLPGVQRLRDHGLGLFRENGGRRSCRLSRSRAMITPTTSGRVARNWPSLR